MKNEIYKEFAENKFSKEENLKAILSKVKEEKVMKKSWKRQFLNVAAVLLIVAFVGIVAPKAYAKIQWEIKFNEFSNRDVVLGKGAIKDAIESGYIENVDMDYVTQDGISIKVDSIIITDNNFNAVLDFKFADDIEVNPESFAYSFAVYDETPNVYKVFSRMHIGAKKPEKIDYFPRYIYKTLGLDYDVQNIYKMQVGDSCGISPVSARDRNIISDLKIGTSTSFPKSKKIYIRITDLGFFMVDFEENADGTRNVTNTENFTLSNSEWIFEIDVPDKFYNRETTELILKDQIPGVEFKDFIVTELGLNMKIKIPNISDLIFRGKDMDGDEFTKAQNETINITDEDGNFYREMSMGTIGEEDWVKVDFDISKNMMTNKKFYLNIKIDGINYSSEIVFK